jgi:hemerythrin-like domain-containing protein
MTNAAAELLAGLRQDHRNMAILLRLWQDQIELIGDDKQPDFALLRDVMRNMTVYSDAIHHPKEDLIYAGLRALQPSLAEGLEQVETEHEEIARLGEQLQDDIEAVIAGTEIETARVVGDAKAYMRRLNQHMAWEEEDLFRRADAEIDSIAIDTAHLSAIDPIFGEKHDVSFTNLRHTVERDAQ